LKLGCSLFTSVSTMGKPQLRIHYLPLPNPVGKFTMCTWSSPKIRVLANLNTGRLIWNPEGLHIRSVQTIGCCLFNCCRSVNYRGRAAEAVTKGAAFPSAKIRWTLWKL